MRDFITELELNDWIIVALVIMLIYILWNIFSKKSIVRSRKGTDQLLSSKLYYYLPKGLLKITSKVKIELVRNKATKELIRVDFVSQVFEHEKEIIPDSENLVELKYSRSVFAEDHLKIKINSKGLLESVGVTTEDKSVSIVKEISKAPSVIFNGESEGVERLQVVEEEVEEQEFSKVFLIDPSNLKDEYEWVIHADKTNSINVSFVLKRNSMSHGETTVHDIDETDGVYSRPIEANRFTIEPQEVSLKKSGVSESFVEFLPSSTRLIHHPIKRSSFVKKEYTLSFEEGIIKESEVKKPSEVDGFISIPINIAKAIVSIPAQLVSFRINSIKNEKALQEELTKLETAVIKGEKNEVQQKMALEKAVLTTQKDMLKAESDMHKLREGMKISEEKKSLEYQKEILTLKKSILDLEVQVEKLKGS